MKTPKYTTLVLDLGDVVFNWPTATKTTIPPKTLKSIVSSHIWMEYERGRITENVCYERVGKYFSVSPGELTEAFSQARDTLQSNGALISFVEEIKAAFDGSLKVYAMSNISKTDYALLSLKPMGWSIFDRIFTSSDAGMLKPDLCFYRYVLEATHTSPEAAVFVDDKVENVFSARSLGMHGIIFDNTSNVIRKLRNAFGDPVKRGKAFLSRNAKQLQSVTENGITIDDNFAKLLILSATKDQGLVKLERRSKTWNFFAGEPRLTTSPYPDDLGTTSMALMELQTDIDVATSVMNEMLEYLTEDGIVQTYFDHTRPRIDPTVCASVLALFYKYGRGHQLQRTLEWVHDVLLHRAYVDGTRYCVTADSFLFFVSRLLQTSPDAQLHAYLGALLKECTQERIGASADALSLAMRLQICHASRLHNDIDMKTLLSLQCEDGGWEAGYMCRYGGGAGLKVGNRGLATALAIQAINQHRQ